MSSLTSEINEGIVCQVIILDIFLVLGFYLLRLVPNDYYNTHATPLALRNPHGLLTICQLADRFLQRLLRLLVIKYVVCSVVGMQTELDPGTNSSYTNIHDELEPSCPQRREGKSTDAFGERQPEGEFLL